MGYSYFECRFCLAITPWRFARAEFTLYIHHRLPMSLSEPGPAGRDLFAESTASSHTSSRPAGPGSPTAIDTDLCRIVGRIALSLCN